MFSKVLAFGLGALALVSAAPASPSFFQLSCSTNFATSVAPAKSFDIEPGNYIIYNVANGAQLRSYTPEQPIFVTLTRDWPGDFAIRMEKTGGKIANVGLRAAAKATYVGPFGKIFATQGNADSYSIEPAGENTFTIKVPDEDLVWAVNSNADRSDVFLKPADGTSETRWAFKRM
ncbi:hypothetical protein MSAN_02052600 [Mycena sanguinolenta]|uniref:Uncharacterized protein n=1 Tax=Mycena sanguinolenta TaxID=230812 RepID=A0A8H6XHZ4_9AGAR|nr:hypothetical protein MSAN_02052600 [Mycena sanguinolenta]